MRRAAFRSCVTLNIVILALVTIERLFELWLAPSSEHTEAAVVKL